MAFRLRLLRPVWESVFWALAIILLPACGAETDEGPGDLYACEPICWKYSSEAVTDDADTLNFWKAMCQGGPSGCLAYECTPLTIRFANNPYGEYAVQCESRKLGELWIAGIFDSSTLHLGPSYGTADSWGQYGSDSAIASGWDRILPYFEQFAASPEWTPEMIEDVLVHELSDAPCEQITDYRQCVRAFIPPRTHCVPVRVPPPGVTEADAPTMSYDWSLDGIDCEPRYETDSRLEPDGIEMLYEFNPFE